MSTPGELPVAGADTGTEVTYREAINLALRDAMEEDPAVLIMGEDVASDGGVFKTNAGLIERFGADRVLNTPIAENGFTGAALGMALMGLRPVVEFMFADFLPTAADAIVNQLSKYRYMSGGQFSVPVTIRAISGGTGRFGTQHSATGESWYMGLPGLRVAVAGTPAGAYELTRAAIRDNNPVLVHEHKGMYGRKGRIVRGRIGRIGAAEVLRTGSDLTIVASLLMVDRAQAAADVLARSGLSAEVVDLRWVRPLDIDTIAASVARTGRLLVVEEQVHAGGWGASVISELVRREVGMSRPPACVSLRDDVLVPYSPPLEDSVIPTRDRIVEAAVALAGGSM